MASLGHYQVVIFGGHRAAFQKHWFGQRMISSTYASGGLPGRLGEDARSTISNPGDNAGTAFTEEDSTTFFLRGGNQLRLPRPSGLLVPTGAEVPEVKFLLGLASPGLVTPTAP